MYNFFNVFNAVSWNLLVGIIITLFALRLGASSTYIGLLSASFYVSLFFLPLGKMLSRRFSIIGVFSFTWNARSVGMIFAVIAPFLELAGHRDLALFFIMLGVFFFQFFRGIGMIGNNPVLNELATGPDQGSYLTQIQIINSAIGMFGSFLMALVLGANPHIIVFSILLGLGIITGIISGVLIKKVPEPPVEENGQSKNFFITFKEAFAQDTLRRFIIILFIVALVSGVTRAFVVVYAREVFGHSDGLVSLYSVFGGLGYLMAGLLIKFFVDRIGAKPIFMVCVIIGLVSAIPVVFLPESAMANMTGSILFLSFLFFMLNFGFLGSEGIAQTYFIALIPVDKVLDMGILYFMIFGIAGSVGSSVAGILLDFFKFLGISPVLSFRFLFASQLLLALVAVIMQKGLKSLGSLPLRGALEVIFSFRDLRAISLLDKLGKTRDSKEEEIILGALHDTPSQLAIKGLLEKACSPRLDTRLESIRALEKMETLNEDAEKALIEDIINNPFTTAYISARILGNHGCVAAIPKLRELATSSDYMLAGEAITALAKMKDEEFRPRIESIILETHNPRLKIMGAEALGLYCNSASLSILLDILRGADPPPYLLDEAVLAIASILGTQRHFYPVLVRFISDNSLFADLCMDEVEAALEYLNSTLAGKKKMAKNSKLLIFDHAEKLHNAVSEYVKYNNGASLSRWIFDLHEEKGKDGSIIKTVLSETVLDNDLSDNRLRLLIVHWAAQELRILAAKIKDKR
ncbi:MAG: MFS transporter [Treponema sp.]|nr:MFS transporter [Treponema sp.]